MKIRVKLIDPRKIVGHRISPRALEPHAIAASGEFIYIDSETLTYNLVGFCPGGRAWRVSEETRKAVSAADPNCATEGERGTYVCEHCIEIGD